MFKKAFVLICLIAISALTLQVEPFSAGEGVAVEIYETALPLLEACEDLIEDIGEVSVDCEKIYSVADESEIDLEPIMEAILGDPNMARFAVNELKNYSRDNFLLAESEEDAELKAALLKAGLDAYKHAVVLETMVEKLSPLENPSKGK